MNAFKHKSRDDVRNTQNSRVCLVLIPLISLRFSKESGLVLSFEVPAWPQPGSQRSVKAMPRMWIMGRENDWAEVRNVF